MRTPTALTIGNFDSVHIGHRVILQRARGLVGEDGRVIAATFSPHPLSLLAPERAPRAIEPIEIRTRRLIAAGADEVVLLEPSPELLGMTPTVFVDKMIEEHEPTVMVEGTDFHFGARRAGNVTLLEELCRMQGVAVEVVRPVMTSLTDQSEVVASSTIVRWLLEHGRVRDAAFVLGRMHELVGTVVQGDQLGRTIGCPTVNLKTECLLPADGVYAGLAVLPDGSEKVAAINIGARPTVQGLDRRAEAHLLNLDGSVWSLPDGMDQYGWGCTIRLMAWVRDELNFDSVETMMGQIGRDIERIKGIVSRFAVPITSAG
ncbi:MAG: hypothetical protein KC996_03200 [Phycisphaerales bacterium]|nr:hypothetical protein [Phycisphaerales bacterium]